MTPAESEFGLIGIVRSAAPFLTICLTRRRSQGGKPLGEPVRRRSANTGGSCPSTGGYSRMIFRVNKVWRADVLLKGEIW